MENELEQCSVIGCKNEGINVIRTKISSSDFDLGFCDEHLRIYNKDKFLFWMNGSLNKNEQ